MFEIYKIIILMIINMILTGFFYRIEKSKPAFIKSKRGKICIGVAFGVLSILGTQFGANLDGFTLNVRDAAPITAGLFFDGISGIIAALIGGIWRWFAALWGAGMYTRVACTIATILAGFLAALIRRFMFENKKPTWPFSIGITTSLEVIHMLMVFLTNMNNVELAFSVVKQATLPMVVANVIVVLSANFVLFMITGHKIERKKTKKIEQSFSSGLLICVVLALLGTNLFTYILQRNLAEDEALKIMQTDIYDVIRDVSSITDSSVLTLAAEVKRKVDDNLADNNLTNDKLISYAIELSITEINYVDSNNIIRYSTNPEYVGFNMNSGSQSAAFSVINEGTESVVQELRQNTLDENLMKYAGLKLRHDGYIQIGYEADKLMSDTRLIVADIAQRRHIGKTGRILLCDEEGIIHVDNGITSYNISASELGIDFNKLKNGGSNQNDIQKVSKNDYSFYYKAFYAEGYYIIACMPYDEVGLSISLNLFISNFIEIMIFAVLFMLIYILIKKIIVNNINKINLQLGRITQGDLDVVVGVNSSEEFASLSHDINSTVDTLKHYIDEAAKRLDAELEVARQIQASMLPNNFDEFCEDKSFDIHASMSPAKEVGGDFYDYFMIDDDHLALVIADVSGKGIPASLFMVRTITNIRNVARTCLEPQDILAHVNNQLCQNNEAQMFVSVWLGIYEISTEKLVYANGGHEYPAIMRAGGEYELIVERHNMVLGGMEDLNFKRHEITLSKGERLFIYTDGVPEATDSNNELFGTDRMLAALKACTIETEPKEVLMTVRSAVDRFVDTAPQFDDLTMLEIRIK